MAITYSVTSAAAALGRDPSELHRLFDRGLIPKQSRRSRRLSRRDLVFALLLEDEHADLLRLSHDVKLRLRALLHEHEGETSVELSLSETMHLRVELEPIVKSLDRVLLRLERARALVVQDPEVRGGEPVVRGTRVPVHYVASLLESDEPEDVLDAYPSLRGVDLELLTLYAKAWPLRGRPKHPWQTSEDEDLEHDRR